MEQFPNKMERLQSETAAAQTTFNVNSIADVQDPTLASVQLDHPTMTCEIGQPALLHLGDAYPSLRIMPFVDINISAIIVMSANGVPVVSVPDKVLESGVESVFTFPGTVAQLGPYELRFQLIAEGKSASYDAFYFTVEQPAISRPKQSKIAYLNEDGRMEYVADYKGNRILDFSNSGYMGGGVKLPNIQARVVVEPGEGDATKRIQDAIDFVSRMPSSQEGYRGAVLLKKGTYLLSGTLFIHTGGVVLRGEGQGEDGTIIYAKGAGRRNMVEIGGKEGPKLQHETSTAIVDLYVPSGARTLRVENGKQFVVGDSVIIRRHGNQRWIEALQMDSIVPRPVSGGTKQWEPFVLDFDRVITGIQGNLITLDAPLANAIERRWGGAELIKYDDSERIEHVGVENLRVDVEFDPSVTDSQLDGKRGDTLYCADENHAVNFAVLNHVKNAWVRDVTGYHLEHSLVLILRNAKWVTVQDCTVLDMVSIITGGRRYAFQITGELALVQRNYTETARHAFVVDSRVSGPNVFLDNISSNDFNASEPHHRWSVGGLYDNVKAPIYIRDRGWMGSGHGWAGANYVTWNTEGKLTSQQPPTAQNYAIGHVGTVERPFLPNAHDPRPRQEAYWEHLGSHVIPQSLYKQQLQDRLGPEAVLCTNKFPVGGGALDIPNLPNHGGSYENN